MRVFEVLASDALLVTDTRPRGDLARLGFEDQQHLVLYERPAHAFELIDWCLAHLQPRETIALRGRQLALKRHTYVYRVQELIDAVERRSGVRRQ